MIGKLKGIIDTITVDSVIIDVQGVGYIVNASKRTLLTLPGAGEACTLYIEMQVREDAITLYGFKDATEQEWFRLLISVQGVGAKAALAILSVAEPTQILTALHAQDKTVFTRADGVGPKLASRIVSELKDKSAKLSFGSSPNAPSTQTPSPQTESDNISNDAISALVNLGYSRSDAYTAVAKVRAANDDLQAVLKEALKALNGQG